MHLIDLSLQLITPTKINLQMTTGKQVNVQYGYKYQMQLKDYIKSFITNLKEKEMESYLPLLTLSQTSPGFYMSAVKVF